MSARAHRKLHHESNNCHEFGILSSSLKPFIIPIGIYILTTLARATTIIEIEIGIMSSKKDASTDDKISHISMNTIELDTKAKNSQNFCICASTLGEIL